MARGVRRSSMDSDSSSSSSPERVLDDDYESVMEHPNDSQSSLSVSLEDMELDNVDWELQHRLSPISRLPAELLIAVFSKLGTSSDLVSCMLVSKSWARNSVDLLWHRPSTTKWKKLLNVIQTARKRDGYFAYHDLIKRINLATLKSEVSDGTLQPLSICKRIERLTLPGCSQLTDMSLVPVVEGNRSLMAIDLSELDHITNRSMFAIAKNCYRLQGLNVSGCKGITDEAMIEVAKNCRRLKRLKLNECTQITDHSVTAFADNCHEILEIDLYRCSQITDMSVSALIKEGKQLRELRLAQCFRITDEAFLQLPPDQPFEALRILDLTDCNELQDAGLQKIIQAAPRLRNLVLAKCRNITDRGVQAITKLGKNLHFLHLGHCANITDHGVSQLVKSCNRIRYIDFSCCAHLTDDSVSMLASLPKLKRIGLVKCVNITDYSIRALARAKSCGSTAGGYHPNNLERLHLSYCTNLTIAGIRWLLINCPQLTHLSLTGVQPFLIEELLRFCRIPPEEFNEHQMAVFCVFSGSGVADLRDFLHENYGTPAPSDAESDDGLEHGMSPTVPHLPSIGGHPPGFNNPLPFGYRLQNAQHFQSAPPSTHHQQPRLWRPTYTPGALDRLQNNQEWLHQHQHDRDHDRRPLPTGASTLQGPLLGSGAGSSHGLLHTPLQLHRTSRHGTPTPEAMTALTPQHAVAESSRPRNFSPLSRPSPFESPELWNPVPPPPPPPPAPPMHGRNQGQSEGWACAPELRAHRWGEESARGRGRANSEGFRRAASLESQTRRRRI